MKLRLPEPTSSPFSVLISEIDKGQIKIPQFQRDFVWNKAKSSKLIDSILKGFPIGTFIFWRTNETLRSIRNIGNFDLPAPIEGEFVSYVLDGQQRITSLFAGLKGLILKRDKKEINYSDIYIDLSIEDDSDDDIVKINIENGRENDFIKLNDLLQGGFQLLASYPEKYHVKLQEYKNRIQSYQFSIIKINEAPIDIATEIFTRINEGGKTLTVFEIMVAKTYENEIFDLSEKYKELQENLGIINYETIPSSTVLQTVSLILKKECNKKTILKLNKHDIIKNWNEIVDSIEKAAEYFKLTYRIPVSQLLPYNALLAPFAYFFYYNKDKPTGDKKDMLLDYFWRVALSGRFSQGLESKLAQDIKKIDKILDSKKPKYEERIDITPANIKRKGYFKASNSFIKALLCILAYQEPKSFNDNSTVTIGNSWLKQSNSKNYHHFFPKAFLKKKLSNEEDKDFLINHICNITIVDDFLNKREIRAKAPSIYMKKFESENQVLQSTMKTHLISNIKEFGIWEDDYSIFFDKRLKEICNELKNKMMLIEGDKY